MAEQVPVKIYVKTFCPYCVMALQLLSGKGVDYEKFSVDGKPDEYEKLKSQTGWPTVPQIFINDQMIGGYTELAELDRQGKLDKMLKGDPSN